MSEKSTLWSHTWIFSQKISAKSVTKDESFHQDIAMEKRYQGNWISSMLADYC